MPEVGTDSSKNAYFSDTGNFHRIARIWPLWVALVSWYQLSLITVSTSTGEDLWLIWRMI
jgi:hypothetical protein